MRCGVGMNSRKRQSGNVVIALFGAVVLLGGLSFGYSTLMKGSARGVTTITSRTSSETDLFQATKILISHASEAQANPDCDGDSFIEPLPWRTPAAGQAFPVGGGLIPTGTSAKTKDSWGTDFGYCVWDHGTITVNHNNAGCGGSSANRLRGGDVKSEYVLAVISAGPDRIFQNSCAHYVNPSTDQIVRPAGSDDIYVALTYAEAFEAVGQSAGLGDVEDDACNIGNIGLMRFQMDVVQICMDDGAGGAEWQEIGAATDITPDFAPTTNANLNTQYTSNNIGFTGFHGTRLATVDNGATIVLNGTAVGSSAQVKVGDTVALRATSANAPEQSRTFTLSISTLSRPWVLTTRLRTVHTLTPSPASITNMWVDGESGTAYSPTSTITITHSAGEDTAIMGTPSITPAANFEITATTCTGIVRTPGQTCTVTVRAKATSTSSMNGLTGTLTVPSSGQSNGGSRNATVSLTADALFPVTLSSTTLVNIQTLAAWSGANVARWTQNRPKRVIIPAGVIIGSTAPATPALQSGTGRTGVLTITNNGSIQGAGGVYNVTSPTGLGGGGTAFLASQSGISLINNGSIWAGGGAGGQGGTGGSSTINEGPNNPGGTPSFPNYYAHRRDGGHTANLPATVVRWNDTDVYRQGPSKPTSVTVGAWTYYLVNTPAVNAWEYTRYAIRRSSINSGGAGGAGGRGQGYNGASATGANGAGGTNGAGAGGRGGTGGSWGATGGTGLTGAAGATAPGPTAGLGGRPGGYAIQNFGNVTLTGGGTRLGQ
jgi:hypothetical protein